jgi:hypothetical protein
VAALVVYFGGYYPPTNEEAYGTIGAAERYRSEQIKAEDVKLDNPEVQAFLQSETFDRLARDPAAREALTNEALMQAVNNDAFRIAFSQAGKLDAAKFQAEMAKLNDAANKLNEAYKLNSGLKLGADAGKFNAEMAKLNDAANKLDAAIKLNTAFTLNQAKFQAEMAKLNDARQQAQRAYKLNTGLKLGADAGKFNAEMAKLNDRRQQAQRRLQAEHRPQRQDGRRQQVECGHGEAERLRIKLNQAYQLKDSAKFQAEMSKLNDAALNLKMSDAFIAPPDANVNDALKFQRRWRS